MNEQKKSLDSEEDSEEISLQVEPIADLQVIIVKQALLNEEV